MVYINAKNLSVQSNIICFKGKDGDEGVFPTSDDEGLNLVEGQDFNQK